MPYYFMRDTPLQALEQLMILIYVRRAPAGIPCHACIPGTAAECGKEAAAGAIFRSGFYSRVFFIRRKTI